MLCGILGVVSDLDNLFFGSLDDRSLVVDLLVKLDEEVCQLAHGLLDALDVVVAGADCAEDAGGLTDAIGFEL